MFALRFKCHVNLALRRIGAMMPLGSCRLAMWARALKKSRFLKTKTKNAYDL